MKKIGLLLFTLVLSIGFITAQNLKKAPKAEFKITTFDFGKVNESVGSVSHIFTFKNVGNSPLIIQRVQAACGCTVPEYPKEPIMPGAEGKIKVTYTTTGNIGAFNKSLTVFSNVPDEIYVLYLKGEVLLK